MLNFWQDFLSSVFTSLSTYFLCQILSPLIRVSYRFEWRIGRCPMMFPRPEYYTNSFSLSFFSLFFFLINVAERVSTIGEEWRNEVAGYGWW